MRAIRHLVERCDRGAVDASALSDRLIATAMAIGPGDQQRRLLTAGHCLVRIAELWRERRPAIPGDYAKAVAEPVDLEEFRRQLLADLDSWSIDPHLDPSTHLLAARLRAELDVIATVLA